MKCKKRYFVCLMCAALAAAWTQKASAQCGPGNGDCCEANGTPGCNNVDCCDSVCATSPFCCNVTWDQPCAFLAIDLDCVCGDGGVCVPGAGPCCEANGTPGCDDADCCSSVCNLDSFCCDVVWDDFCANVAEDVPACDDACVPACGPGNGDCCVANGTVGCDDVDCCNSVCGLDPFCCDVEWDGICADEAVDLCSDLCECSVNADCDDGDACTVDSCDQGTCVFDPLIGSPACEGNLTLEDVVPESGECQGDAGDTLTVELWMRDLPHEITGFQAFVEYDDALLSYRGDLSSYTAAPFPLHVTDIADAEVSPGSLQLDGSIALGKTEGTDEDSLLATLIFDIDAGCDTTSVDFATGGVFESELSFEGLPVTTGLIGTRAFTLDNTPPVLADVPADITVPADAGVCSAVVTFDDPTATDNCDVAPVVACSPVSGSVFPTGTTTVICTATDTCDNSSLATFDVTVNPVNVVNVEVELAGVTDATTRCIHFVTDDCAVTADHDLAFSDGFDPVRFAGQIEIPCGNWTQLCAKDEQHTQWNTTPLSISGTEYDASALLSLIPGDTDNDGDIDINDITWLILQFGDAAADGFCPYDGVTRDADFDNDGAVDPSDYTLLVENWLTATACSCVDFIDGGGFGPIGDRLLQLDASTLPVDVAMRVDLNGDGVINAADVELFEDRNGLPRDLSRLMRAGR